jgi:hypothetical protein
MVLKQPLRETAMSEQEEPKKRPDLEGVETAALTGVGAGVGGAGGATFGVLELAATQGSVSAFSAGVVIGAGAVVGGLAFFLGYKAWRKFKGPKG